MPIPISEALLDQEASAVSKAAEVKTSVARYLVSAALAGAFVGVAFVLLLLVSTAFIAQSSPSTKLVQGAVFGVALTLVVFAGAELFTGNIMVMIQGVMKRVVTPVDAFAVWVVSLLGNLIGALGFSALVAATGVINAAPKGKVNPVGDALAGIVLAKTNLNGSQLFFRSVLCNFLVCLALWMAARTKSDAAKLICLWWALLAFVASGFEHSIANMTVFGLAIFVHTVNPTTGVHLGTAHNLLSNLLVTVPGNMLGGGLLVGAAYGYLGKPKADKPIRERRDAFPARARRIDLTEPLPAATRNGQRQPVAAGSRAPRGRTTSEAERPVTRRSTPPPRRRSLEH